MDLLHIDFESRSRCNLVLHGSYNYAQDLSTEVACMGYALNDEYVNMWSRLLKREKFPKMVREYIGDGGMIAAHNATFERLLFWYIICPENNVPEPKIEQFYCTASQCRVNAYPGKLENACRALATEFKKDMRGHALMMKLCKPARNGEWYEDPEELARQEEYCLDDVRTERAVHHALRGMTDKELEDYWVNEHLNDRGILVDMDFAIAAQAYATEELDEIKDLLIDITEGFIETPRQFAKIKEWLLPRMSEDAQLICQYYDAGEKKHTLDKNARYNLMMAYQENPEFLSDEVIDVIELLDDAGKSSVSKFKAMQLKADFNDHRVRGSYMFNGAPGTGRFSALGLQPHNFKRDCYKGDEADKIFADLKNQIPADDVITWAGTNMMDVLAKCLRPCLIAADGYTFISGDWKSIEARLLPWLTGDPDAEVNLNIFRKGGDVYVAEASNIYNEPQDTITSEQRQIGKVAILSLGYYGGVGAFKSMAKQYQVVVEDHEADRIKNAWREANPWAPRFWRALHDAACDSIRHPDTVFTAGKVSYITTNTHDHQTMWCLLPSGRLISYPRVTLEYKLNKFNNYSWQITALKGQWLPKKDAVDWPRFDLWPGLLAENVTQAAGADILRDCMFEIHTDGRFNMALDTHDEIVLEVPDAKVEIASEYLKDEMLIVPEWAKGLPLDVDMWISKRYRK